MNAIKVRFIERDYYKKLMESNSRDLSDAQIEKILTIADANWVDLTFKFFDDGSMIIMDNDSDLPISVKDLKGAAYDFYVKQRIRMIRANLEAKILQTA
ncbi:hypothetical protein P9314_11670 [Paenibacillus validus]|uniref:Uncharacterized protein n=1 Tax=Paenibacillus validus TaxID=44253 RepID=A0A7X3CS46_9BACL|nr:MULTISPECIES: hypothetical protein [Paenibacillus]MED4601362.1 hypothetical protein [Paenibacillus validus]MED4608123.1 hypothetical protein [Paenibacillus validus]MUG70391.1 hypothetical protein [Paenibacillus validus]